MDVFLAKKDGKVIYHTDLAAMEQLDGITKADKTVTIKEWEAAGSTAYIDKAGKIILGKTPEEKEAEAASARIIKIDNELAALDLASIRSSRAVSRAIAKGKTPNADDLK
jgi:hypothetical protein